MRSNTITVVLRDGICVMCTHINTKWACYVSEPNWLTVCLFMYLSHEIVPEFICTLQIDSIVNEQKNAQVAFFHANTAEANIWFECWFELNQIESNRIECNEMVQRWFTAWFLNSDLLSISKMCSCCPFNYPES